MQRGLALLPVLLVVALLILGGGAYWYEHQKAPSVAQEQPSQSATTTDETAGWRTYANTTIGWSISYPASYHVAYDNDILNWDETDPRYEKGNPAGAGVQVQIDTNTQGFNLAEPEQQAQFVAKLNAVIAAEAPAMETAISPVSLGEIKYKNRVLYGPGGTFDVYYAFAKDGKSYYRLLGSIKNDPQNGEAILKSFEPSSTTPPPIPFREDGVRGPTSLKVGEQGSWEVYARDGQGYAVIWGDGTPGKFQAGESGYPAKSEFSASQTVTHTFAKAGEYYVQFFAEESSGSIQTFTLGVSVR